MINIIIGDHLLVVLGNCFKVLLYLPVVDNVVQSASEYQCWGTWLLEQFFTFYSLDSQVILQ